MSEPLRRCPRCREPGGLIFCRRCHRPRVVPVTPEEDEAWREIDARTFEEDA